MKNNRKKLILPGIVATLIVYAIGGHYYAQYQKRHRTRFFGNIEIKEVDLGFKISGTVDKTFFEEGDVVKQGDVMAELDNITYAKSLSLAEANMNSIEFDFKNAQARATRNVELYEKGFISLQEYENLKYTADSLRHKWIAQQKQFALAKENFKYTKLIAPSDGVVITKAFEPGSVVSAGQSIYTVLLTSTTQARGYISELALTKIEYGMPVVVETDGGEKYGGKVTFVSPKAEFTPKNVETEELKSDLVYRFKVTIENPDGKLKQGMPVVIKIVKKK